MTAVRKNSRRESSTWATVQTRAWLYSAVMHFRRRDIALVFAVVAINSAFALSDRAATYWGSVSDSLGQSSSPVAEVVTSTGVTTSKGDWAVHFVLWGVCATVAVVIMQRPRRYVPTAALFLAVAGALELLQNIVTIHRSAQWSDMAGNLAGICVGLAVGYASLQLGRRVASTRESSQ